MYYLKDMDASLHALSITTWSVHLDIPASSFCLYVKARGAPCFGEINFIERENMLILYFCYLEHWICMTSKT